MSVGAHGVLQGGLVIAAAPRFDVQSPQGESVRLVMLEHLVVGGDGGLPVAGELRRLRAKQLGHRVASKQTARIGGVSAAARGVARSDCDQPA